jgi:tripartite-type tricarboxylate transporter receptor subunit TctC
MKPGKLPSTISALLCAGVLSALAATALAQDKRQIAPNYPTKPIRVLVSVLAGGGMDMVTRTVTGRVAEQLPVTMIVENVAGASGAIAVNTVASAAPDGHTLLSTSGSLHIGAAFKKFDHDVRTSLQAIQQMSFQPYMLIVRADAPFKSTQELVAYAKKNPGKLTYGSSGAGSPIHMGTALIEFGAGIDMVHVPYKGNSAAQIDLAAGRLDMTLTSISGLQLVRSGKARLLAITASERHADYPDTPTIAETIIPDYEVGNAYMLYAPGKTPPAIVNALNREVQRVLANEDLRKKLIAAASMPGPARSPAQWQKQFVSEIGRWESVIKKANIKLEE